MSGERYSIEEGGTLDGRNVAEIYTAVQGEVGTPTGGLIQQRLRRGFVEKKDPPGGGSKEETMAGGEPGVGIVNVGDYLCSLWGVGCAGGPIWEFGGWGSV